MTHANYHNIQAVNYADMWSYVLSVVSMKSESFDTDHDVSNKDEEPMSMSNQSDSEIYDDIGAPDDRYTS